MWNAIKNKKIDVPTILYLLMFGIFFLICSLKNTEMKPLLDYHLYSDYYNYFFFPIMAYVFFSAKRTPREYAFSLLFLALFCAIDGRSQHIILVKTAVFVICLKAVDYKKVFKVAIGIMAAVFAACLICCGLGIVDNVNWNPDGGIAYGLGYIYSTYSGYVVLFASLMYMAIREHIRWFESLIIIALQVVLYPFTGTMTTLLITIIVMAGYWILNWKFKKMPKWIGIVGACFPPLACLGSILAQWAYDENSPIWQKLNSIFIIRLQQGHNAIDKYDFTLLGQKIWWVGVRTFYTRSGLEYNYVDNFFLKYALTFGVLYIIVIVAGFSYALYVAAQKKNIGLYMAIVGIIIFGILDAEMADMRFQPMVLVCAWMLGIGGDKGAVDCKYLPKFLWRHVISIVAVTMVVAIGFCGYNYICQSRVVAANAQEYPEGYKEIWVDADDVDVDKLKTYLELEDICQAIEDGETFQYQGQTYDGSQLDETAIESFTDAKKAAKKELSDEDKSYMKKYKKALKQGLEIEVGDTFSYTKSVKTGVSKRESVKTGAKWGLYAFATMLIWWGVFYILTYYKRCREYALLTWRRKTAKAEK